MINSIKVKALPTSYPYYHSTFSILFKDQDGNSIFHEGHRVNFKYLKANKISADVSILTAEETKLFGFIQLGMNYKNTLKAIDILQSKILFITGNEPNKTEGFISKFLFTKSFNLKLLILGNGKQNKSYLHVEDLINAFLKVIKKQKKKYDIFNVSTDDLITVNEIANIIFKVTNLKTKKKYTGGNVGWKGDVSYIKLSNKKLKRFGWEYKYKTSLAVEKTIKENIHLLNGK